MRGIVLTILADFWGFCGWKGRKNQAMSFKNVYCALPEIFRCDVGVLKITLVNFSQILKDLKCQSLKNRKKQQQQQQQQQRGIKDSKQN